MFSSKYVYHSAPFSMNFLTCHGVFVMKERGLRWKNSCIISSGINDTDTKYLLHWGSVRWSCLHYSKWLKHSERRLILARYFEDSPSMAESFTGSAPDGVLPGSHEVAPTIIRSNSKHACVCLSLKNCHDDPITGSAQSHLITSQRPHLESSELSSHTLSS